VRVFNFGMEQGKKEVMDRISRIAGDEDGVDISAIFKWLKDGRIGRGFEWEMDGDDIMGSTRDNGNVGDETPGIEDMREGRQIKQKIEREWKDSVIVELDTTDEWTNVIVRMNPRRRKAVMESIVREAVIASRIVRMAISGRDADLAKARRVNVLLGALERLPGVDESEIEKQSGSDFSIKVTLKFSSKNEHGEETTEIPEVEPNMLASQIRRVVYQQGSMAVHALDVPKKSNGAYGKYYIMVYVSVGD
jgi:hypothetical protein